MGIFLAALDATIVATIFTRIGSDFERSNDVSWVATSYMLTTTAFQPLYGRLSDVFGRKPVLIFALTTFLIGSAFCGMAPSMPLFIFSRAFAGVGGGGILTTTSIIMTDLVPLRDRGRFQGYGNAVFGSASMVGAPLGGWLADNVGWRWAFWVNLPVGGLAMLLITVFLKDYSGRAAKKPSAAPASSSPSTTTTTATTAATAAAAAPAAPLSIGDKLRRIDYAGCVTLVVSMTLLVLGLSLGGNERTWDDPLVVGSLCVGAAFLAAFVFVEGRLAAEPIMPLRILAQRTPAACYWTNFFSSMTSLASVFLIPLWFQVVLGNSAAQSGAYLVPKVVSSSLGSITSGVVMGRTGKYLTMTHLGLLVMAVAPLLFIVRWNESTSTIEYLFEIFIDGFSFGLILTTTLIAMLAALPSSDVAVGSAMSYLFRATGTVLGVSLSQSVFQAALAGELERRLGGRGEDARRAIEAARRAAADVRKTVPKEFLGDVVDSYRWAIKAGFAVCAACAVASLIGGLWIKKHELPTTRATRTAEDVAAAVGEDEEGRGRAVAAAAE
ncbi:major facilitator superfamily domain-containing protein [Zopfochytrium polystomum]|nr:major facilitator superfamily domain-containing protein [Zopfochytrium polystomum]